jgi:two-component system cell cycle sensor histidine kinase/response regulator CckA
LLIFVLGIYCRIFPAIIAMLEGLLMGLTTSRLTNDLPDRPMNKPSGTAPSTPRPSTLSAPTGTDRLRHILIVDDDPGVLFTFQNALDQLPECEIETAASAAQAWQRMAEQAFDLLITDYRMPDTDGLALAARSRQAYPATAVLMITAFSTPEIQDQAARLRLACVLDKPASLAQIRAAALSALDTK